MTPSLGSRPRESDVEGYLDTQVRRLGGFTQKIPPAGRIGVPDRMVLLPDQPIHLVELKRPGGRLSPGQVRWHEQATAIGHKVVVLSSRKEVDQWLQQIA